MNEQNWVENEAVLAHNTIEDHTDCEECEENYLFRMKDNRGEFALGLRTVLACLSFAEQEGAIPEIPAEWWLKVYNRT